ncbi:hypothetical protein [Gordonia zhaorongruii]|uniref:hypothetical protein n=1 Tax=Gordonia zhaorongruii TaxID=2597659 RepID=UPI00117E0172|nr:hypothetical protein [Gordonia zhaorongruii]
MTTPEFGFTAWGADIVRIAEPITTSTPNVLAPRARRIARNDGVTLAVDGRQVTAHVHRGGQASVAHLEMTTMDGAVATAARELMGPRTEPDDAVHAALRERGLHPAPSIEAADCSCRARTMMCVHVLAALYALASLIDHEPSTVLTIQSFRTADSVPAGDVAQSRPIPRWTPLAALDVRGYYAARPTAPVTTR